MNALEPFTVSALTPLFSHERKVALSNRLELRIPYEYPYCNTFNIAFDGIPDFIFCFGFTKAFLPTTLKFF